MDLTLLTTETQSTLPERIAPSATGRILVVEDDASSRVLMRRVLEGAGYQALTAASGEDPRHGEVVTLDVEPAVIWTGEEGVYQHSPELRDGLRVYLWQPVSRAESQALIRGDLRANQEPRA